MPVHGDSMIHKTIQACPIDLRREMYGNIVLSGGTTLLPNFSDRLRADLRRDAPARCVVTIHEEPNRHLAVFRGTRR